MANELEDALAGMGFNMSDDPAELEQTEETTEETTQEVEQPEESNVLSNEEETVSEPVTEVEAEQELVEDTAPVVNDTDDLVEMSDEEYESTVLQAVSEMLGQELSGIEELRGLLNTEQPTQTELNPEVEAIAKFVQETGRSVNDWFAYQSFNPSEMDDVTVMMTSIQREFPELSDAEAKMILNDRYKLDEDLYSENEAKLGSLNLKMDAQKTRNQLSELRESYKAPKREETTAEPQEIESPITEEWINTMSNSVDEIEALELEISKDKTFSFGLRDDYKATLKDKNAKLDEFFDPYVDDSGNWDFDTLSAHRAIIDNIEEIAKSIYAQGLSDGQSKVVKEAVNPSSPAPQGAAVDAASAQDKVRQQVLDALRGGDERLRIKF